MAEMTPEVIRDICRKSGGYAEPRLNDQLFLHHRGFRRVAHLSPYTHVKVLWLDHNALDTLHGLPPMPQLVTLVVSHNALRTLEEMPRMEGLRMFDVAHNVLRTLKGIAQCPRLESLQAGHNRIETLHPSLHTLDELSSLDIAGNPIESTHGDEHENDEPAQNENRNTREDGEGSSAVEFFRGMRSLAVLNAQGCAFLAKERQYRRRMIAALPTLTFLDDRPVNGDDRRANDAWTRGGPEAEAAERAAIKKEKEQRLTDGVRALAKMAADSKDLREVRTREWEKQKEKERAVRQERQELWLREIERMEKLEEDCRAHEVAEEFQSWSVLEPQLREQFFAELRSVRRREEQATAVRNAQESAKSLLVEEGRQMDALGDAPPSELRRLFDELESHDDEVVSRLEAEMRHMLDGFGPTVAPSNPATIVTPPPPSQPTRSCTHVWEQYRRWELRVK